MKRKPSTEATAAWIRLMRVQSRVLDAVEQDLKKAGFPPLAWYDALLELSRAPSGEMRPVELQKKMWSAYSAAIEKHVGSKLSDADAVKLCGLLDRLGCACGDTQALAARDGAPAR